MADDEPDGPKRDDSCSLCGHKNFKLCGCPWHIGFSPVPAYKQGRKRFPGRPGWDEFYQDWVMWAAPCSGPGGWKPPKPKETK